MLQMRGSGSHAFSIQRELWWLGGGTPQLSTGTRPERLGTYGAPVCGLIWGLFSQRVGSEDARERY